MRKTLAQNFLEKILGLRFLEEKFQRLPFSTKKFLGKNSRPKIFENKFWAENFKSTILEGKFWTQECEQNLLEKNPTLKFAMKKNLWV